MSQEDQYMKWMKESTSTMVHEIGHMFGIEHCIYYECIMNGSNGSFENYGDGDITLCPSCLAKLKMNIGFDTVQRHEKLFEACQKLGFDKSA